MDQLERSERIKSILRPEQTKYGKIHTYQIAIPESEKPTLSKERNDLLEVSLTENQSNLFSIIVRPTTSYGEDQIYEVVYGADWCLVAKQLEIEMLWAWSFDLTDEQAAATKAEMERLAGSNSETVTLDENLVNLIGKKLEAIQQENYQRHQEEFEKLQNSFQEKFSQLEQKIDRLKTTPTVEDLATLIDEPLKTSRKLEKENALKLLNDTQALLSKQATAIKKEIQKRNKINLLTATESQVKQALKSVGIGVPAAKAAWKAIEYWKKPGKKLTWENLALASTRTFKDISGFSRATYNKLREIGEIEDIEKPPSS